MGRILVVDDDAEQLSIRMQLLKAAGHEISGADCAAEAIRLIKQLRPAVLLMDLRMPALADGLGIIRFAAAQPEPPRIVVMSGWPDELEQRPEAALVSGLLLKPTPLAVLLDTLRQLLLLFVCLLCGACSAAAQAYRFDVARPAEVVAELEMSSPGSDWSKTGREAALATLTLDRRAAQHVMLYAGEERYTYQAFLGALDAGGHELRIERHPQYSAPASGLKVWGVRFREVPRDHAEWQVLAHAPILYARADTVGLFTDVPMLAYCERLEEAGRRLLQYTVIFSNEDGGTSTRALMARWGRTTDIEYIYRAWLDGEGEVQRATIQAEDHREVEFRGRREGAHPVLIPATRNNMVADEGTSPIRYQIPPALAGLTAHSREEVMDGRPITYRVAAQELEREGKLRPFGVVDGEKISDPRNYLTVEMKLANRDSAVAVYARLRGETLWRGSHLGRGDYAVWRDGWVRTTIELPPGTAPDRVEEFAFACVVPPAKPELLAGTCRIEAVSKVFQLGANYVPGPGFFRLDRPFELSTGQVRAWAASAPARNRP